MTDEDLLTLLYLLSVPVMLLGMATLAALFEGAIELIRIIRNR